MHGKVEKTGVDEMSISPDNPQFRYSTYTTDNLAEKRDLLAD